MTGFSWDPHRDSWHLNWTLLRDFLEREHRLPRYRANDPSERELAAWVHKQRHLYRRGQLLPERLAALQQLPFRII
ncbi:helicase associated domain-containing protein [Lacisediminihabitans sp. H27-G8]|uniref:helicase associated domain-containing protein n=1 Tax=Lacisediminihabitans sp. H27-G8 TaxID=3111909 RepID=UPI0038FD1631